MGLPVFYDEARAYLRSLTDNQAELEELLAYLTIPNARKVFVLQGAHCGKSTFLNVMADVLPNVDFRYHSFYEEATGWDASSVIETEHERLAELPEDPFAVLIIDTYHPYIGPLPATTIVFRSFTDEVKDMREKLRHLRNDFSKIVKAARHKHTTTTPIC